MTVICAVCSLIMGMAVHQTMLPESDGAKGALFFGLVDPFVLWFAIPIAGLTGLVALPIAIILLIRTRLKRSIPVVFVSTLLGAALGAWVSILVAPLGGLVIGGASMVLCSQIFQESVSQ
jgi:hypothetical protein